MDIKDSLSILREDVFGLSLTWQVFRIMYGNDRNCDLMHKVSPALFYRVREAMVADILRRACAITDPPKSLGKDNLVLEYFWAELRTLHTESELRPLADAIAAAKTATMPLRQWRNKRLAHRDFEIAHQGSAPLPTVSNIDVDKAVHAIFTAASELEKLISNSSTSYELSAIPYADTQFAWLLKDAVRYEKLRRMASDQSITDTAFRAMVADRYGSKDPSAGD